MQFKLFTTYFKFKKAGGRFVSIIKTFILLLFYSKKLHALRSLALEVQFEMHIMFVSLPRKSFLMP